MIRSDERGLPRETVAGGAETGSTSAAARPIGATVLDHAFADARPRRATASPASPCDTRTPATALTLWVDDAYPYLMVFTGDPLPDVNRRALAVEPMTCPPDAFRSGESLVRLEPGERWSGAWGITPAADGAPVLEPHDPVEQVEPLRSVCDHEQRAAGAGCQHVFHQALRGGWVEMGGRLVQH